MQLGLGRVWHVVALDQREDAAKHLMGHGFLLVEAQLGDILAHKAGDGAVVAFRLGEIEPDRMGGKAKGIVPIAVVDGPDQVPHQDLILRGLPLFACLQHALDPWGEGAGHLDLDRISGLNAGNVGEGAQIVMERHAQGGIFLTKRRIERMFGRGGRGRIRLGRARLQGAHAHLVAAKGGDHKRGFRDDRPPTRGPAGGSVSKTGGVTAGRRR